MKIRALLLICTALSMPVQAKAAPIGALFYGLQVGLGGVAVGVGVGASAFFTAGVAIGTFFGGTLGSILLNIGVSLAIGALTKPKAPRIEDARVNTRLENAERWIAGGRVALGGTAGSFMEFDEDGNFWFIVAHADAELNGAPAYILDGIAVEIATVGTTQFSVDYVLNDENYALSGEVPTTEDVNTSTSTVLVRGQTDPAENGIWVTSAGGWSRAAAMPAGAAIGYFVVINPGSLLFLRFGGGFSVLNPSGVVGTDDMVWSAGKNERVVGDVLTDDFCLTPDGAQFEGTGPRVPYWRIFTVTPSSSAAFGALPSDFTTAFPNLPSNFRGAGVCFSIIRGKAVEPQYRNNAYRWRGVIGVGEPAVVIVGNFERMYDPRNGAHDIDVPSTWTASNGNPAIVWAWFRTNARGRGKTMASINWANITTWANIFDTTVLNRAAVAVPLYRCGVAFSDSRERADCEAEILNSCDGFVAYDDQGRAFVVGGYYQAPTITIDGGRDVLSAVLRTADDGETPLDGVICEYISPDHGYTKQQSAPWRNTRFYDGTREPNYAVISVTGCQDHNQAVRIAKAYGERIGPARRIALGTTIKGILTKGERAITLNYDAQFDGVYEVATNVEEDASGMLCRFAAVPLATDRWTLGAGEEGAPPVLTPNLNIDKALVVAANVSISAVPVLTAAGAGVRFEASFDAPANIDRFFRFRYTPTAGAPVYEYFITDMDELSAYSAVVSNGVEYRVSWQTATQGGRATVWSDERDTPASVTLTATANPTAPAALVAFAAADGAGSSSVTFTTANDANQFKVGIYRGTTTVLADAALITTIIAAANVSDTFTNTGLSAGTYYFWGIPINGSNVAGTASGPDTAVVA